MNKDLLQGFYLGDLLVEPLQGRITGRAISAHLPPKAVEVLLCLASEPGQLVTREMLTESVWGSGQGSPEALSHAVSEIRQALDDHADEPRYIQTLPRRGYRLIVTPEPVDTGTASVVIGSGSRAHIGLIENLRQRGVLETGLAYLVLGWLLIQVADIVFGRLDLPDWAGTFVIFLVIAGFPIALVLSWFLEFRDGRTVVMHQLSPRDRLRRRFSRTYVSVIGGLAIAAVCVFAYDRTVGLPRSHTSAATDDASLLPPVLGNSIAVLPFLNIDGSDDTRVFSNGLVDDLITRLSRVPGLRVASRGDAFTLEPNSASRKVRERLRVARYLEGSVQITGNQMRVTVQLIDSADGFHVLSRSFDRARADYFALRDEITALTVANVRVALPPATREAPPQSGSAHESLDAYVLYRRGIDAARLPRTSDTSDTALGWFDAALKVDPDYAAAYAGKCTVFVQDYTDTKEDAYIGRADDACSTALELNPNLDIVHTALGDLDYTLGRYADAESHYLQALTTYPNSVAALTGLGETYLLQQKPDEAEARFRQAIELHPGDWSAYNKLGYFLYRLGRYRDAAEQYARVVALDRDNMMGYSNLGTAYMLDGEFRAAAETLERAADIQPNANTLSNLGLVYYYLGRNDDAVAVLRRAVKLVPGDHLNWSNLGDVLTANADIGGAQSAYTKAQQLVADALAVNPNDPATIMDAAWINAMLGSMDTARQQIARAREQAPADPYVHYIDGLILLRAGDVDGALAALETAAAKGYPLKVMAAEPLLASLHGNPRFDTIVGMSASR